MVGRQGRHYGRRQAWRPVLQHVILWGLRTLHVDLGRQWRGGQNQALLAMQGLRSRDHIVELIALRDAPLARKSRAAGFMVHEVASPPARLNAARLIRGLRGRFDVVHCHDADGLTAAWLASAHRSSAVVASRRVAYPLSKNRIARARYISARKVVAVSRFVADSVVASEFDPARVEVIYDGVPTVPRPSPDERSAARWLWNIPEPAPVLGCVGYLLPEKGQELLVRALPRLLAKFPDARLLLAGGGPCMEGLERQASSLGVRESVLLPGIVPDVERVYAALDVFLFPSLAEPLGSSLLTAMAYGLPAVAAAGGAVPEIITDGENGFLVERDAEPFAEAVIRALGDSSLAVKLGSAARRTIEEKFSADRMVEATLDLYGRVCAA